MSNTVLHRIERDGRRFVLDTDTCFCFECDAISWDVLDYYPHTPSNHIVHVLQDRHPALELEEVIGELEWLRATKSILPIKKPQDQLKDFEFTPGLRQVDVVFAEEGTPSQIRPRCEEALHLLFGRSGVNKQLQLDIHLPVLALLLPWFPSWATEAFGQARLAGKQLTLAVTHSDPPQKRNDDGWSGHRLAVAHLFQNPASVEAVLAPWVSASTKSLSKALRTSESVEGVATMVRLTPGHPNFETAVRQLVKEGFTHVDLDLPGAYLGASSVDSAAITAGLESTAKYYAHELLSRNYFRLEPIAGLFQQIYEGNTRPRIDDSGTHLLCIDGAGDIYPARQFVGVAAMKLGNTTAGEFDEGLRGTFDDLGVQTTTPCGTCWARNLCGGGHSAIHFALSGGIRRPHGAWCDAQREWFGAAISAFNILSAEGVDFSRVYQQLRPGKRPSLWNMARAALTMKIGLRPIEEADAPLLTRWENWSEATYFLGNEYGLCLATRYDREMDSLHPRGIEQEFVIVNRRGVPLGLLKVRPDHLPGVARVWVFFEDKSIYEQGTLRKSFAQILKEAAKQGMFKALIASSGPGDGALGDFLASVGFETLGVEREALFLHDSYHDVQLYRLALDA